MQHLDLPPGVIVMPFLDALVDHADKITPYLGHIIQHQHAFHALNTAMLERGMLVYVPAGVCVVKPIVLTHWQDKEHHATYLRHLIVMEEGSVATVVEDYQGENQVAYFTNTLTEVHLAPHATLTHSKIQQESHAAFHQGHLSVRQLSGSRFESHSVSMGGKWVRSDISIMLQEPGAQCLMNGIAVGEAYQHVDHHTLVVHAAPHGQSVQDYKTILSGHAHGVFNGRVVVMKDAQQTQAQQQNKNVLLTKNTEMNTKPQLEIDADDVMCTHGATVGQLDEDALFYLTTRGIDRATAHRYLVQAFMVDNLRLLAQPTLIDWVRDHVNRKVG
jgi:Fe-S cluster assembly protein SufD